MCVKEAGINRQQTREACECADFFFSTMLGLKTLTITGFKTVRAKKNLQHLDTEQVGDLGTEMGQQGVLAVKRGRSHSITAEQFKNQNTSNSKKKSGRRYFKKIKGFRWTNIHKKNPHLLLRLLPKKPGISNFRGGRRSIIEGDLRFNHHKSTNPSQAGGRSRDGPASRPLAGPDPQGGFRGGTGSVG